MSLNEHCSTVEERVLINIYLILVLLHKPKIVMKVFTIESLVLESMDLCESLNHHVFEMTFMKKASFTKGCCENGKESGEGDGKEV
jgi:hypothetical protein